MKDIKINPDYQHLIPPLSEDEFKQLENNCVQEGIRDAICLWNDVIVDGHNRYNISRKHGLGFKTRDMEFNSKDDAKIWIIKNQLGRRNIDNYSRVKLELELEATIKGQAKERQLSGLKQYSDNTPVPLKSGERKKNRETNAIIAKRAGVGHSTVDQVKIIKENATSELETKVINEEISINAAATIATLPPEEQNKVVELSEKEILEKAKQIKALKKLEKDKKLAEKKAENMGVLQKQIEIKPKVYNTNAITFLSKYKDESIDLLITDPPYSTDVDDIKEFAHRWVPLALQKVKDNGRAYICIGAYPKELHAYLDVLLNQKRFIIDNPLIWTYRNALGVTPKYKYNLNYQVILHLYTGQSENLDTSITNEMFSVQDVNAPDGRQGDRFHSWQKPDELARRLIAHGSKEGDLIVDPYCGTGTFVLLANKMKRDGHGCDISDETLEIAVKRGCELNV